MASRQKPVEGPDFLCVGMAKAGTQWLFDQLQFHPDFWMPPVKEIHYLDREFPRLPGVKKRVVRGPRRRSEDGDALQRRVEDLDRDAEFLEEADTLRRRARDIGAYTSLFRFKGNQLSGDVTPGYGDLPEEVIGAVARRLPDTKIVLLIRDPVARAWSHICMWLRNGKFDASALEDADGFHALLQTPLIAMHLFPTKIAGRWKTSAPGLAFRHFFFDDIVAEPESTRRDILVFLGAHPEQKSGNLPADFNRKSSGSKIELTDTTRALLIDYLKDELKACADMFGGHAREWASRYGV